MTSRWWFYPALIAVSLALVAVGVAALTVVLLWPNLPSLEVLTDYRPKIPLRVYSAEGELIGEFGEEKRAVVKIADVPEIMKKAILAAEDDRFYQHGGVDYTGVARAAVANLQGRREGASTITMQVARTFFLTREKTFARKLSEVLLAFKIEALLTKDQILELYVNQIFLGQRAYGFGAAANIYFGKDLKALSPAEAAMLAGLPQAPSRQNPLVNPKRAQQRQQYVLRRMHDLGWLAPDSYKKALTEPLRLNTDQRDTFAFRADYVAEMARAAVFEQYGDPAYVSGIKVYTTVRRKDQEEATAALRLGVYEYDRRHGYRGPEGRVELPEKDAESEDTIEEALQDREAVADLVPAVVLAASAKEVTAVMRRGDTVKISGDGLKFAARSIGGGANPDRAIRRGSIVRLQAGEKGAWSIAQVPKVEAALVSLEPSNGAIHALAGGFDFNANKFNHVTQAWRQPGSSFKPFIYSAALEKGFTAATVLNDAPFVIEASKTGGQLWEPKNYDGKYEGPMRLRTGLAKSKNMISIRLLQAIGPGYAQDYIRRFGFDPRMHPAYLTMALGAGSATPLQMATAYATFANGGYRVKPWFITRIVDDRGETLYVAKPELAGESAERVLDERNAFLMTQLMRDVVRSGTAARAMSLGRNDLAGKTGTTNDHIDAWFAGFQSTLVAVSWIGFDTPTNLGVNETGGQAALPIWMSYMGAVLKGVPEGDLPLPSGVVAVNINPVTGLREADARSKLMEFFYAESQPAMGEEGAFARDATRPPEEVRNQIF
ncbi:penicillin-binding protein 1A [Usitatibacter palustris]|uniref:Penicillin-binding protein 1A n=1 Tax=Usitatibacter palustris TaxID=2732487 RepID=A0A6M4H1M1_9PROT|nr:penicillin-binding protein 1A [Usitatibacter palustris]QJR13245.1 Penicillin-binding protein 1A [Usitatibacter palustris]